MLPGSVRASHPGSVPLVVASGTRQTLSCRPAVGATSATVRAVRCINDTTVAGLATGQLTASELTRAEEHAEKCPDCRRALVAQLAATLGMAVAAG